MEGKNRFLCGGKKPKNPTGNGLGLLGLGELRFLSHPRPRISLNTPKEVTWPIFEAAVQGTTTTK